MKSHVLGPVTILAFLIAAGCAEDVPTSDAFSENVPTVLPSEPAVVTDDRATSPADSEADHPSQDGQSIHMAPQSTLDQSEGTSEASDGGQGSDVEFTDARMPRLTTTQYLHAIDDIFGPGLPELTLEADTSPYLFFSIGATSTVLSARGVELFSHGAEIIAQSIFRRPDARDTLIGCAVFAIDDGCAQGFLRWMGRRLYRRPLTEEELTGWLSLAQATMGSDPYEGLATAVEGMLQSPHFLYRIEVGEPDVQRPGINRYTPFEMASRISFLATNSIPDDELLDAAERGELLDEESLLQNFDRLLEGPRAKDAIQNFFAQYLDLGRLSHVERDRDLYPLFTASLLSAMQTEIRLLVEDLVFRRQGDVRTLFSARRGYVNSELAELYGVDAPGATPNAFVPIEFPLDIPRAGILTLGAFLTMNAHQTETSPTLRGKYVRERVLCQVVPPPPDDIDLNLEAEEGDAPTLRERLEQHREDPACSSCHAFIDPPGFLFENFDSLGQFRTEAEGYPIDAAGDLDGRPLSNGVELADVLSTDPRLGHCLVRQLYRHAQGRLDAAEEAAHLTGLYERFESSDFAFLDLLRHLVVSESFRMVRGPSNEEMSP